MSNGFVSIPSTLLLAALAVPIAGCDSGAATTVTPYATSTALERVPTDARYRLDPARNRLWVLTPDGVFFRDANTSRPMTEVNLPGWQALDASFACPPDLALGPDGAVLVTSNTVSTLWRIDPATLAVSVHELALDSDRDKDVGFSALAYSAEHGAFFAASDVHGSLWRIDPLLRTGRKVALSEPIRGTCAIAIKTLVSQSNRNPPADLCAHAERGTRSITLSPDQRSARVGAASCLDPFPQAGGGAPPHSQLSKSFQ